MTTAGRAEVIDATPQKQLSAVLEPVPLIGFLKHGTPFWTRRDTKATRVKCVATGLTGTKEDGDLEQNGQRPASVVRQCDIHYFQLLYTISLDRAKIDYSNSRIHKRLIVYDLTHWQKD